MASLMVLLIKAMEITNKMAACLLYTSDAADER